jgi:hypothetical protein
VVHPHLGVDEATARRLMADLAVGGGLTHWRARFIPGGPACIWREWPGLTDEEFRSVRPPGEAEVGDREATPGDSVALPSPEAQDEELPTR